MDAHILARTAPAQDGDPIAPYVPALLADWLRERPDQRHRTLTGTLVFADVSGFTRLTEMLSELGKRGAEEMAELINGTFTRLLAPAREFGADLIKWGGDATLLLFDGPGHVERGARAAFEMQSVMRHEGRLQTSRGSVRLRMSIGLHSGQVEMLLVGSEDHRELLVIGDAAGAVTNLEKAAGPGEIIISQASAEALADEGQAKLVTQVERGLLLRSRPEAETVPAGPAAEAPFETEAEAAGLHPRSQSGGRQGVNLGVALCRILREHVLEGAIEGEHRHVTIGFIKFSGVDELLVREGPDAALAALEHGVGAAQSAAEANGVTFMATDVDADGAKVMLGCGAPRSVGHDADRMIATARSVIDARGVLPVKCGISAGRTFTGDFGPPYRRTYSMLSDSVNTAARLMAHAKENELLVAAPVLEAASGTFVTAAQEPLTVKGKRRAVPTFSVGALMSAQEARAPENTRIVGREDELRRLLEAERRALSSGGQVVELVGPPGMGKSTLLEELKRRSGADVLCAQGDIYARTQPYAPFTRLLRSRWGITEETDVIELIARMKALVGETAPHLLPWLPLIGIVAGLELPMTAEVQETDPGVRKARLEELTSEVLGAVLSGPTAFLFEDVHLMDEASTGLISRLAADVGPRPWLIVVSRPPEEGDLLGGVAAERIELGPLGLADAERLLAEAMDASPLPPHKVAAVRERAGGNPLFLRELVAHVSTGGDPDALPSSVEGAIAARIDALPRTDRTRLRAAAVLGQVAARDTLCNVLAERDAGIAAGQDPFATLGEFLAPDGPGRWRFRHQLVREVAYESLPYRTRTQLHARTAAAIEDAHAGEESERIELLSMHCFHGGLHPAAWRYSRAAAEGARSRYANAEAAELFRRALAAAARLDGLDPLELGETHESLGDLEVELGELDAADRAFRRALARTRPVPHRAARVQLKLARLREISARHTAAIRWVQRAEATLDGVSGPGIRALRAQLAVRRARIRYRQARYGDALQAALSAVELARASSDRHTLAEALEYAELAEMESGNPAGTRAEEALAIYEEFGDLGAEARVRNTLGMVAYHKGRWSDALEHYRAAENAYDRSGRSWAATISLANRAEILVDQDRLDEAEDALRRAMRTWRGVDAAANIAFGEYQLARIDARRGDTDEAMLRLRSAREHFAATGELIEVAIVDAISAECLCLAGREADALSLAEKTLARTRTLGEVASAVPLLQRVRGSALLARGDREGAVCAYAAALDAARSRDAGHEIAFTLRAMIDSGMADGPAQESSWREECELLYESLGLSRSGDRPDRASSRRRLSQAS